MSPIQNSNSAPYGLDFGTSNSAIAARINDEVKLVPVGQHGEPIIKSVVYFPPDTDQVLVGDEAVERYVELGMRGRLLRSLKTALKDQEFSGTMINGQRQTLESLIAHILRALKSRADVDRGQASIAVTLGRPAVFSTDATTDAMAEQRLRAAAIQAGFMEITFQLEPIAAALDYQRTLTKTETVLIADLGGGTSDFTLIRLEPGAGGVFEVIGTSGVYIGGDSFDAEIMRRKIIKHFGAETEYVSGTKKLHVPHRLMDAVTDWHQLSFIKDDREEMDLIHHIRRQAIDPVPLERLEALIEHNLGFALSQAVEAAKIALSNQEESLINFENPLLVVQEPLTRQEFNEAINPKAERIFACVDKLIVNHQTEIDALVLTGGTSKIPYIREWFEDRFGVEKIKNQDTFTSVAAGLAIT